jgi:hypothetical protein
MIPVLDPTREWYCPNCGLTETTKNVPNRWHPCAKRGGLVSPLLPAGMKAKVETHEREDYVGTERVFHHEGRPIMNITTTRDDGSNDVIVFAPTAAGDTR